MSRLHVPALKGYQICKEQVLLFALLSLAWESAETLELSNSWVAQLWELWMRWQRCHSWQPDIPTGVLSVGHTCLAGSAWSCLGSCFPKWRMLCPLSLMSLGFQSCSHGTGGLWSPPESPPQQQPGPGKVRVGSGAPWAAGEWSNAELCFVS